MALDSRLEALSRTEIRLILATRDGSLYYTRLALKKYRFLVKAGNSDGVWNGERATLDFFRRSRLQSDALVSGREDMELSRERFYAAGFRPGHSRHASNIVIT
jgi:hypothetical protein